MLIYFNKSKFDFKKYIFKLINSYNDSLKKNAPPRKDTEKSLKKLIINNNSSNNSESIKHLNYISKYTNQIIIQNINQKKLLKNKNKIMKIENKKYFDEYLSTDPNELDYDDAIEKDKRTFCQYFFEKIKNKQLIINSFFIDDKIKRKSIKIIIFLLNIDFYLLFNGLLYSEKFIIELYSNNDETLTKYISRYFGHLIYIFIIIKVLNEFLECFFIQEKRIKRIFIRGKNHLTKIKQEIFILIKKIESYYIVFIIISFVIFLFSFFYISCFNDAYYYTRIDWIKSTSIFFIIIQIFSIIIILIETIIRFLGIKYKCEKLFNLNKMLL